jgi:AcrR family transcriptional regulator
MNWYMARSLSDLPANPKSTKRIPTADRREELIVNAALDEFTRNGFAATRMDDIAKKAGVAKGTLYLYFRNKQSLFQAILQRELSPLVEAAAGALQPEESVRAFLERALIRLVTGPGSDRRRAVIRLLVAETARFPKLAETYFRTVVQPGIQVFSKLAKRAFEQGELRSRGPVEFPQLIVAPAVVALLWTELFHRFQPLDAEAMLQAHLDQLFPSLPKRTPRASAR